MSKCAVKGCCNTSKAKFKMNSFPRNSEQRALWLKNMGKKDWTPNTNSRLCEAHFAPEMWEKTRVDGTRKLKFNAVPTIFEKQITLESKPIKIEIDSIEDLQKLNNVINLPTNKSRRKNIVLSNNQTLIKILPTPSSTTTQPTQTIFPSSFNKPQSINQDKISDSKTVHVASGAISILKPQLKSMNMPITPIVISTNVNVIKDQMPMLIPSNTSILKSQVTNTPMNINNNIQDIPKSTQRILIPVSSTMLKPAISLTNSQVNLNMNELTASSTISKRNEITTSKSISSKSIILNKTHAKKLEDERFQKMDKLLLKQLKLNNALRKKLNYVNHKMQQLLKEQNKDCKAYLRNVFTDDQIRALELRHNNPKSITAWSHKTMIKALRLKEECGTRGYEELLKQNYPLPSVRTICRWCTQKNLPIP